MKALFYRKCSNSKEYEKLSIYYKDYGQLLNFKIFCILKLSKRAYQDFCNNFLKNRDYISSNKNFLIMDSNDLVNCLFITNNNITGYLVYPAGHDYARYVAYYDNSNKL